LLIGQLTVAVAAERRLARDLMHRVFMAGEGGPDQHEIFHAAVNELERASVRPHLNPPLTSYVTDLRVVVCSDDDAQDSAPRAFSSTSNKA